MKMSLRTSLLALTATSIVGFLIFGAPTLQTLNTVKVRGPLYSQIVLQKDLLADILPPPAYILESYLVASEAMRAQDAAARDQLVERGRMLEKTYGERVTVWTGTLPAGKVKDLLLTGSQEPAREYFKVQNERFFPALLSGDAAAASEAFSSLRASYEEHRRAIDTLVEAVNQEAASVEASADATLSWQTTVLFAVALVVAAVVLTFSRLIGRSIIQPTTAIVNAIGKLSQGDLTTRCALDRDDELGQIGRSVDSLVDRLNTTLAGVNASAARLTEASRNLKDISETISGNCEQTASQASTAREASADVSKTLQMLAAAAEEMTVSIQEAARNTTDFARQTVSAVETVRTAGTAAEALKEQSDRVGQVLKTISAVAGETSSLAQVATAEAKRASDAGNGFAVVALEVKELARESGRASEDISDKIRTIQRSSNALGDEIGEIVRAVNSIGALANQTNLLSLNATIEANRAINAGSSFGRVASQVKALASSTTGAATEIESTVGVMLVGSVEVTDAVRRTQDTIAQINQVSESLAAASEEQSATAKEMARNVATASVAGDTIAKSIADVADVARSSSENASRAKGAAQALAEVSAALESQVAFFRLGAVSESTATEGDGRSTGARTDGPYAKAA